MGPRPDRVESAEEDVAALDVDDEAEVLDVDDNAKHDGDDDGDSEEDEGVPRKTRKRPIQATRSAALRRTVSSLHLFHPVRDVEGRPEIDVCVTLCYVAVLAAYATVSLLSFLEREKIEDWSLVPQSRAEVPAILIELSMVCSEPWGCTDFWNDTSAPTRFPEISESYRSERAARKCPENATFLVNATSSEVSAAPFRLCWSPFYDDGLDVVVPFDSRFRYGDDVAMNFLVTSPDSDLYLEFPLEPSQRKTVFFGQQLKNRRRHTSRSSAAHLFGVGDDRFKIQQDTSTPYASDLFYDGKNDNATALLRLRVSQFANVATIAKDGAFVDVLAQVGGFHAVLWTLTVYTRGYLLQAGHSSTLGFLDCLKEMN